ncbi:MAG: S41 family peptidase, partial [Promethearchaeota archaeon]
GEPEMVQLLASYFLNGRTQLNQIERRYEGVIEQYWTLPFVPGKKMVNCALYVLTSSRTFSAAEDFIYGLKCLDRITIIGETTKGGAHPVDFFKIQDQMILMVPTARTINPKTSTNWEGVGISPDISINSESAFDTAYVLALKNLIKSVENETEKKFLHLTLEEVKAQLSPEKVGNGVLQNYTGSYGYKKITLEGNQLYFQSKFFPKSKLIPITQTIFRFEGENDIRIAFTSKNDSDDMEIVFYYKLDREIITSKKD